VDDAARPGGGRVVRYLIVFILGGLAFGPLWLRVGSGRARALRAYRDLIATRDAIRGLLRRTVSEWVGVVKAALVLVALAAVLVVLVVK
jgi:hypothetical protein